MRLQQQEEVKLTPDELQSLMRDAIQRHGQAERQAHHETDATRNLATVEDALAIARELNIPEERVMEAVRERNMAKLREQRRGSIRSGRQTGFWLSLAVAILSTLATVILGAATGGFAASWMVVLTGLFWLAALFTGWRWMFAPVDERELDRKDLMPVAGTCRVCGAPAYNERATFCAEHQWKGPGSQS